MFTSKCQGIYYLYNECKGGSGWEGSGGGREGLGGSQRGVGGTRELSCTFSIFLNGSNLIFFHISPTFSFVNKQ